MIQAGFSSPTSPIVTQTHTHSCWGGNPGRKERQRLISGCSVVCVYVCVCWPYIYIVLVIYLVFISSFTSSMNQEQWLCVTLGIGCLFCYVCLCWRLCLHVCALDVPETQTGTWLKLKHNTQCVKPGAIITAPWVIINWGDTLLIN